MSRGAAALAALALVAACSAPPPGLVGEPVLTMNPNGTTPLSGTLTFTANQPVLSTLVIGDSESSFEVTPGDAFAVTQTLPVLGLKPDRVNTVELRIANADGLTTTAATLEIEPEPLPKALPPINLTLSRAARMEPGITLLSLAHQGDDTYSMSIGIDERGDVVWFYDGLLDELRPLANGNFLAISDAIERRTLIEIDLLGNLVRQWHAAGVVPDAPAGAIPVEIDLFHHDITATDRGSFLALATERRIADAYPTSETDPDAPRAPREILADELVEFDAASGAILRRYSLLDMIDSERLAWNPFGTDFYETAYDEILDEPLPDWTHANGVHYDAATNSAFLSVRKQSVVIKLDLDSGDVEWLLGDPTRWREPWSELLLEPEGELEWSYGHHAPELTANGTLLLYDNGSYGRAIPPNQGMSAAESYSRAVEYAIDEANGTVRQIWHYGTRDGEHFFANIVGDVDTLPVTGNLLIANGGQIRNESGEQVASLAQGRIWNAVIEVTHTTPPEKVWELVIDDPSTGWIMYRAERVPSLYR